MSQFQSKKFKDLQKTWYSKLKDTGFEEIEDVCSDKEYLKNWHNSYFQVRYDPHNFWANQEYYRLAGIFLEEHTFVNGNEKNIWKLHVDGLSIRKIAKQMDLKIWFVHRTIEFLEAYMKWYLPLVL